ncbi:MAG: hypothetical protein ACRYGK_12980 [Janthinobacterium lividum]
MAVFPSYARVSAEGYSEAHSPTALRSDMDRGMPKQRKVQSDTLVTLALNVLFLNKTDAASFEDWYYSATGAGAGTVWFDFTDPRTGAVRSCRAVAGTLGALSSMGGGRLAYTTRTLQIEYLRAL